MTAWVWAAAGCGRSGEGEVLPPDGLPRGEASAEERARYDLAAAWSESHGGRDLVIVRGDAVVYERAAPGIDPLAARPLFSGTKSFGCLLVQAAIGRGDVGSLDERVGDAFPAVLDPADPRRASITVRHLLQFTSGLAEDPDALTRDGLRAVQRVPDKVAVAAGRPLDTAPGERFDYGSVHLWVLSGWFRARTGQDPIAYLDAHVLGPIGFEHAPWVRDPAGNPALAYGAATTAGQWAKVGMLLRDDGVFRGARILPAGAVAECATGSAANPAYGLTLWLNRATDADLDPVGHTLAPPGQPILWPDGPADLFVAAGARDQRLYVFPTDDLVVSRLGDGSLRYREEELLARLVAGADPPGGCATAPSAPGAAAVGLLLLLRRRA